MDEGMIYLSVECYSEKTRDFIGCGLYVHPEDFSHDNLDIVAGLDESFWELLCAFESSAQQAFDEGIITGTAQNELFKVFGHFQFTCTVDDEPITFDLGIDPDDYMYPRLVEYLEIKTE